MWNAAVTVRPYNHPRGSVRCESLEVKVSIASKRNSLLYIAAIKGAVACILLIIAVVTSPLITGHCQTVNSFETNVGSDVSEPVEVGD